MLIQAVYAGGINISSAVNKEKTELGDARLRTTVRCGIVLERLEVRDHETGYCSEEWQKSKNTSDK